jgi:hypothetical protein
LEAAKYISESIKEKPKDYDVYVLCGDVYTELEKYDSALKSRLVNFVMDFLNSFTQL